MLLLAVFAYLLLFAALVGATVLGARLSARLLRVVDFRWFDSRPAEGAPWRRFCVRAASALAALAVCSALFWVHFALAGERQSTTTVSVREGPARDAGMRDGDRVLSVDGVAVEGWEALRGRLKPSTPVQIEIERAGARSTLRVTPNGQGRIAVSSVERQVALGPFESAKRAVAQPFEVVAAVLKSATSVLVGKRDVMGPVGIVRETSQTAGFRSAELLWFMGTVGSYFLPQLVLLQLFDALTLPLFLRTHPRARDGERSLWRLARVQQALLLAVGCFLPILALVLLDALEIARPVMAMLLLSLLPVALSIVPLVWIAGVQLWGAARTAAVLIPGIFVPCAMPLVAVILLLRARSELRQRRFRVGLLVATPQREDQ